MTNFKNQPISMNDLFRFIHECYLLLKRKWKVITGIALCVGILAFLYVRAKSDKYEAVLTFSVDDKGGSSIYSAVASQFGIDMSKSEGGAFKGDNLIEVFRSQSVIEQALLTKVNINDSQITLIDRFLLYNPMLEPENSNRILFPEVHEGRKGYTRFQDSVLHLVSGVIQKHFIEIEKLDKKLTIIKLIVRSNDELFSQLFTENLASTVYKIYTDSKVERLRNNIDLLQKRIDSVKVELNSEMFGAANSQDHNQNSASAKVRIPYLQRQLNIQLLTTLNAELVKNMELSKLTLAKEEPLIQVIDYPIPPLKVIQPSKIQFVLAAIIGSAVFVFIYLLVIHIVKNSLQEYRKEESSHD